MNENNVNKKSVWNRIRSFLILSIYESLIAFVVYWGVLNKSGILVLLNVYFVALVLAGCIGFFAMSVDKVKFGIKYSKSVLAVPLYSFVISSALRLAESLFLAHNNYIFLSVLFFMTLGLHIVIRKTSNILLSERQNTIDLL